MNKDAKLESGHGGSWWRKDDKVSRCTFLSAGFKDDPEHAKVEGILGAFFISIGWDRGCSAEVETSGMLCFDDEWTDFRAALAEARKLQNEFRKERQ